MTSLQSRKEEEDRDCAQLAENVAKQPRDTSSSHLLEVVRFLRREKEIAESRYDVISAESSRLKHQLENAQQQLQAARKQLQEEREKSQVRHNHPVTYLLKKNDFMPKH